MVIRTKKKVMSALHQDTQDVPMQAFIDLWKGFRLLPSAWLL
jgi:hypothetical protein